MKSTSKRVRERMTALLLIATMLVTSTTVGEVINARAFGPLPTAKPTFIAGLDMDEIALAEISENATSKLIAGNDYDIQYNKNVMINNNFDILEEPEYMTEQVPAESLMVTEDDEEEVEPVQKVIKEFKKKGWTKTALNVRELPNTDSEVLGVLPSNYKLMYAKLDDSEDWVAIKYKKKVAYVSKKYISKKPLSYVNAPYETKSVSGDRRKSYMDYTCITSKSSPQYKIQHSLGATTAPNGVRWINGRYLIALGSYYTHSVGQYIDLVLENGTVIECILGDQKDNRDTNSTNSVGNDGSVAEFVVETMALNKETRLHGNCSFSSKGWNSKVTSIKVYDKNLFE